MEKVVKMKKEQLLQNIEIVKQEIEDGKITDLVMAGSNHEGNITTKITANGTMALGLTEILKDKVKREFHSQEIQQDFLNMLKG